MQIEATAHSIAQIEGINGKLWGDKERILRKVISAKEANASQAGDAICWIADKYLDTFAIPENFGLIICSSKAKDKLYATPGNTLLEVDNPRLAFVRMLTFFFEASEPKGIHPTAIVHPSAEIAEGVYIGPYCVVEEGVTIGQNTKLEPHTIIKAHTEIGEACRIGPLTTIGHFGFGYERDEEGNAILIPHLGNVVIGNRVHIKSQVAIDRAVMGSTILEDDVKVDNLVHLAHGCHIKKGAFVIAHAMVAGSTVIGENTWIAPGALINNGLQIGANVTMGTGAVAVKSVADGETIAGSPAESIEEFKKTRAAIKKLKEQL